jgi:anti-sigma B factor antagonist
MTFSEELRGDVTVLKMQGSFLGEPETSQFQSTKFRLLEAKHNRIVLDLSELKVMNSSGLGTLISALVSTRNGGGDIRLSRLTGAVKEVIKNVQLDRIFKIFETAEQAVDSFK